MEGEGGRGRGKEGEMEGEGGREGGREGRGGRESHRRCHCQFIRLPQVEQLSYAEVQHVDGAGVAASCHPHLLGGQGPDESWSIRTYTCTCVSVFCVCVRVKRDKPPP